MSTKEELLEKARQEIEEKIGDTTYFSDVMEEQDVSLETLAAMGNVSGTEEMLAEMEKRGLKVRGVEEEAPKSETPEPTAEDLAQLHMNPAVEQTPENLEHYWKLREMAQEKMADTGMIQSYLEDVESEEADPASPVNDDVLTQINTASYQGNFAEVRELYGQLKKEDK